MSKKIDSKGLFAKIESLAKERMLANKVVSLQDLRSLQKDRPARILVVEDDETVRRSLQRILESEKYQVVTAENGLQLSQVIESFLFDLIVLDVGLPWINGFELAELMKQHEDIRNIPLVFISGHNDIEMIKKGFASGADDYLTKPFELQKVLKTIKTLLELNS